jgi:hypothetical protein
MPSTINSTTTAGVAIQGDNSGVLALQTNNGTTAVTIDTSQNVGIGTASPQSSLQVSGAISSAPTGTGVHLGIQSSYALIQLNGGAGAGSVIDFSQSGSDYLGRILYENTSNYMFFATNTAERMRIDSSGRVLVGLTSANTSGANFQVSQGVTFPATQSASSDANTLDDYEEGTWTPALSFTANTGITYGLQNGRYTKIGRMVTVGFFIDLDSKGSSTGGAFITGLPFPAYNVGGSYPVYSGTFVGEGGMSSMPTGTYALAWSDSRLYLRVNGASGFSNLTDANFTNSSSFYGTVTYEAT